MWNEENGNGASNLLTLMFGIAIGVAGTLIYAATNEDQFKTAIRKTKRMTGKAQDAFDDYVDEGSDRVHALSAKVHDGIESAKSKVKSVATDAADSVEHQAKQAKREINS